jgi:hypothetical protein
MGFLVIMPFGFLAGWIVVRIFLWLRRGGYGAEWWKVFGILALAGVAMGVWFAFFTHYSVSKRHLAGFPIPLEISSQETPDGPWLKSDLPPSVRAGAILTDVLAGLALCLAPVAAALFFKENKGKLSGSGPAEPTKP